MIAGRRVHSVRGRSSDPGSSMRFRPMWSLLLALSLAVGFSLGDLHCAWMAVSSHGAEVVAAAAAPAPGHACCKSSAATTPAAPSPADDDSPCCGCQTVPAWTLPSAASPALVAPATAPVVAVATITFAVPLPLATWTLPLPATGSPPRPVESGAHGLRAPPTTV
jgi:hypothetical protein